jgi:drug/metabolite transporter (DMT)-like permease
LLGGFSVIYFVWGSTFLAVKFGVASIPPLLLMGLRSFIAGAMLLGWARWTVAGGASLAQWGRAVVAGALLFLGNHGGLAWSQKRGVPSGLAAVLVATIPLWVVVIEWAIGHTRRPGRQVVVGVLIGFAGTVLLVGPAGWQGTERIDRVGTIVLSCCAFLWATGTLYARQAKLPASVAMTTGMQMLCGGVLLVTASGLAGEWRGFDPAALPANAWLALAYLTFAGSLLGFSTYVWLLRVVPAPRVTTYAYVNPVVAMFLGWLVAGEVVSRLTLLAVAVSLLGVFLVVAAPRRT